MSTTSSSEHSVEITEKNLQTVLQEDERFVDFFNTFLALPCFAERLFYNTELDLFEEFTQKLADDVGKGDAKGASQLHEFTHFKGMIYNVATNQSHIGYYVTLLKNEEGLEFVKKRRLPLYLQSELYAEYKLSKHLSVVQDSFFRDLYSDDDDDDDSGVEEPTILHPMIRTRSVVSFNLSPSLADAQSTDGEGEGENEEHLYLPTRVRSIEETFEAWHESLKRSESRASMFSSGASSPYPQTPQIMEEEEHLDLQSCSSDFSAQESVASGSNPVRPLSRMSFVSDNSNDARTLSVDVRSRMSSASSVSLPKDTASQTDLVREELNAEEKVKSESAFGADEMTRSLSSVVSFITEHGQITRSSPPPDIFGDEPKQSEDDAEETSSVYRKEKATAETEPIATNDNNKESALIVGELKQNLTTFGVEKEEERNQPVLVREEISANNEIVEDTAKKYVPSTTGAEVPEELLSVSENHINGVHEVTTEESEKGKIPRIVENMFSGDEEGYDRTIPAPTIDSNVEADSINENNESVTAEVENEELSVTTNDLSNLDERFFQPHVKTGPGIEETGKQGVEKEMKSEENPSGLGETECLRCQGNSKRKVAIPVISAPGDVLSSVDSAESKVLESDRETELVSPEYCERKTVENETKIHEEASGEMDLNSEVAVQDGTSVLTKNEQEVTKIGSLAELQIDQIDPETQDSQVGVGRSSPQENQEKAQGIQRESGPQGSQDESEEKNHEEDDDDEGGYTTEASATTLQGIRGVLGRRLTRCSTAATSVGIDLEDDSALSEDGLDMQDKPYDLATKEGLDAFKEFLLETSGEKLLQFWLEVESGRFLDGDEERTRLVQSIRDRFCKSGGIYEFSTATKTRLNIVDASKITYNSLFGIQPDVLEPLLSYWCIRFTMHQQRRYHSRDLEYNRLTKERPKSCVKRESALSNLPQVPSLNGLPQVLPSRPVARPLSSTVKPRTQHQTSRPQLRAKSAHPRLLQPHKYVHTNASSQQLEYIIAPVKTGYGFEQPPGPSFPVEPEPDYLPSVRLFINPFPSPDSKIQRMMRTLHRTAVFADGSEPASAHEETGSKSCAMLDSLIQGLIYERQTGKYFQMFLQKSGNKTWMNCLAFWKSLQEYNAYFFADSLNPSLLSRKARSMFANFVVSGSDQDIQVGTDIQMKVHKELEPPYEELFDAVEEHVLNSLLKPWNMLVSQEKDEYSAKVATEQTLRHIEIKMTARRRQSIVHTSNGGFGDAEEEQERDQVSVEEANRPMPVPKDGFTFETLIRDREEVEHFKEFLNKKHGRGIKDLMAWTDMETFRRVPHTMEDKRDRKAREIRDNWLGKKYFFGPDSPATREGRNLIMNLNGGRPIKERPQSPVIFESQKFVRARIERRWLMLFKQTTEFLERQKPRVASVPEMVEDIMLKRRLQRSEAAWKILNSRWVSSSRDVVALRQTLLNPDSCSEFTAFVAIKGDTLESNVQFWLEVQKFKDLCHAHAQPALIQRKVQTIVDCFLTSAIAPELQIDIPIEMAEKLTEKLSGRTPSLHPYVFREAQMTVFRVLFNHWKEFVTQRSKIPEGVNPREHFAELLRRHRADTKSKKEASERRRLARLSEERKKKEKEDREKRRIEDLASLFSMETASFFYAEEDDLRSWFYSKHLVELERQEHIKRLREQGIIIPEEEMVEDKEETKSRRSRVSMAKSSTFGKKVHDALSDKKSSEGSSRRLQAKLLKSPTAARSSSVISTSLSVPRRNSGASVALSRKDDKMVTVTAGKDEKGVEKGDENDLASKDISVDKKSDRKSSEIQVIPLLSPETADHGKKLLPQRSRSSKRLLSNKQPPKSAGKKHVPLDAISCISDYSVLSNIEFAPRNTSAGKSLLTSKSLKDFTNSPEGAQLSMPLPLVRITSASHQEKSDTDCSIGEPSPLNYKPRPLTQSLRKIPIRPGKRKRLGLTKEDIQVMPDVIVN